LARVFRRYLKIDPTPTEYYIDLLISSDNLQPRPLEAAKHTLLLARKAARGKYKSVEGRSPYALLGRFLEIVENHADEVGLDVDEVEALRKKNRDEKEAGEGGNQDAAAGGKDDRAIEPASTQGETLIRLAGPAVPTPDHQVAENRRRGGKGQAQPLVVDGPEVYDPDVDPPNSQKLDIEAIIRKDGLEIYKDQAGRLWTGLATFWIKKGEFDKVRASSVEGESDTVQLR
jgi:pre-mRNA-splicing factor SYF1